MVKPEFTGTKAKAERNFRYVKVARVNFKNLGDLAISNKKRDKLGSNIITEVLFKKAIVKNEDSLPTEIRKVFVILYKVLDMQPSETKVTVLIEHFKETIRKGLIYDKGGYQYERHRLRI